MIARPFSVLTATLCGLLATRLAVAQDLTSSTAEALDQDESAREALKQELKDELKEELREELTAELSGEGRTQPSAGEGDSWAEEEWKWEEPVKPELNFLEIDGYFRFRYQLFKNLDLSTYSTVDGQGPFANRLAEVFPS